VLCQWRNSAGAAVLWQLCRWTCSSQHCHLRTGWFCWRVFTTFTPLLTAASTFISVRKYWSLLNRIIYACLCTSCKAQSVTKGSGQGGSCPRVQHARGHKTASPKIFYDYFNDHKSEFDKFGEWANSSLSQVCNKLLLFCHIIGYRHTRLAYLPSCFCVSKSMWIDIMQLCSKFACHHWQSQGFYT